GHQRSAWATHGWSSGAAPSTGPTSGWRTYSSTHAFESTSSLRAVSSAAAPRRDIGHPSIIRLGVQVRDIETRRPLGRNWSSDDAGMVGPACSQHYHLADGFPLVQPVEALVDLLEPQRAAFEPVGRQPSVSVERD